MSAEQVAFIPQGEECRKVWLPDDQERWEAYCIEDGPGRPAAVLLRGVR